MNTRLSKEEILATLPVGPGEDPFVVTIGGFYRRWLGLIDDLQLLIDTVKTLKATDDELWVPAWSGVAEGYESRAHDLLRAGDKDAARKAFLQAKTFYSLARYPSPYRSGSPFCPAEMGPLKSAAYNKYLECFARACELLEDPPEPVTIERAGMRAQGYLRLPRHASPSSPVPAVLVMCGGDMYKEDRERYVEGALSEGLAALAVDAPGTGQTTFPHHPDSVIAWQGALDMLAARPEVDATRIGAFGVSRGGLWVMRLAALDRRVRALISISPAGVGYEGTAAERAEWLAHINARATYWFGPQSERPKPSRVMTEEQQRADFMLWSLKHNGLLDRLKCPMLLVNGKRDHLSPIGNLYLALESGPLTTRVARVYPEDGHIAPKNEKEWGPVGWRWLREQLARPNAADAPSQ